VTTREDRSYGDGGWDGARQQPRPRGEAPGATTEYYVPNRKDQTTTSATDTVNNVEQVYVTTPVLGTVVRSAHEGTSVAATASPDDDAAVRPRDLGNQVRMGIPTGLSGMTNGNNRIDLTWDSVDGATSTASTSAVSGGSYTQIATVSAPGQLTPISRSTAG